MPHSAPLISTLAVGLVLAFAFGLVAQRLRLPPLIGYLLAGIAIGPFTPGFVADQSVANQLAEIGVILLMFGVGLHFSLEDLLSVRAIAVPGALAQVLVATPLGMAVGWWQGWTPGAGLVFGIALSIASTVVLLRLLQERRLLDTERGRITVGWLVVQDLGMVLVLVLLPALAGVLKGTGDAPDPAQLLEAITLTLGKVAAFIVVMLVVGRKVIPLILHYVAHTGSRELFRLAVLSIALGFAYLAAELFGVSLALGAFFAGMILSESRLSQQAATESLPLRDAFAVLFFVSVGMLFDPRILIEAPAALFATLFIILIAKTAAAYLVVRLFGHQAPTALSISVSLAQIGEFSFILAGLGVSLAILPESARSLILAGAIISILLNPLLIELLDRLPLWRAAAEADDFEPGPPPEARGREPIPTDPAHRSRRPGRPWPGRQRSERSAARGQASLPRHRERSRCRRGASPAQHRDHHRQCRRSGSCALGESRRCALPVGGDPRCLRGRAGRDAGARGQSGPADHRAGPFRGGGASPEEAWRHDRDHGRARNRASHDRGRAQGRVGAGATPRRRADARGPALSPSSRAYSMCLMSEEKDG